MGARFAGSGLRVPGYRLQVTGARVQGVRRSAVETVRSFRDLRVYQELKRLHLEVHSGSLKFPRFELYELGSQIRRSSNAAPAILAEGYGSRHTNIYIEAISHSMGEIQETQHHLDVACEKDYLSQERFRELDRRYGTCVRMLERLQQSLSRWRGSTRFSEEVREEAPPYGLPCGDWEHVARITDEVMEGFDRFQAEADTQ
jgi:four helix bundle protein